jgi:hypothetical protein
MEVTGAKPRQPRTSPPLLSTKTSSSLKRKRDLGDKDPFGNEAFICAQAWRKETADNLQDQKSDKAVSIMVIRNE